MQSLAQKRVPSDKSAFAPRAVVASLAAVITGNTAHDSMRFGPSRQDYVHWHEYAGTTVMILAIALSALRILRCNQLTSGWL